VLFGVLAAVAFCAVFAVVALRRFTRADSACPDVFAELREGYDRAKSRLEAVCGHTDSLERASACAEARGHVARLDEVFEEPAQSGLPWLLGSGYLDSWRRLHAVDGALMLLEPDQLVVGNALADEMRLQGSTIPQCPVLQTRLRVALKTLSHTVSRYFIEPLPSRNAAGGLRDDAVVAVSHKDEARAALAQVRSAINEFRDSRREGLVRARNRLFATVLVEGITGTVALGVVILSGANQDQIIAMAAYFLVGGIVGLVRQLQVAATSDTIAEDDYGLGIVRLFQTPLLAGLAGIGGVVLVQLAQPPQATAQLSPTFLSATFDLHKNPYGLVAAAIFGLAPGLLLSGLQRRVDQFKTDLSSSTTGHSPRPDTT
jgi:hypothetical protein